MGQEFPETCRILKFVLGSFELDTVIQTEASVLGSFCEFSTYLRLYLKGDPECQDAEGFRTVIYVTA